MEPFILDTDWSADNNAVGAVLSQKQEGLERVICYGAKRLNKAQAAYSPTKGELAGVIIFMTKWKYFLQHRKFILRIDHKALCWIRTMVEPTGMIQRWLDILASYDFEVQHRPGPSHGNADGMSRAEHLPPADSDAEISDGERIASCVPADPAVSAISWEASDLRQQQADDPDIGFLRAWVRLGKAPPRQLLQGSSRVGKIYGGLFNSLSLDRNDVLRYTVPGNPTLGTRARALVVLPRNLWSPAMWQAHEASAHMAAQPTVDRALKNVYFPGMLAHATALLRTCAACQTKSPNSKDQRALLQPSMSGYPFQKLSLDFVGPLPPSSNGNTYILTVLDTFTRWLEAFPLRAATADRVVKVLVKEIFSRYGICEQLHSDRGTQFTGDLVSSVAQTLGISHTQTPAYNPKSNPVERQHRTLQQALTALVQGNPRKWEAVLPHALFAMRTAVSRSTGFAPFQLMFGRDPATNLDLIFGQPRPSETVNPGAFVSDLQSQIHRAHHWARANIGRMVVRQRRAYHAEAKLFTPGQTVWLFTPRLRPGQSKKLATYWTGPWTITRRVNDLMYELRPDSAWTRKSPEIVSIDRLKLFFPSEDSPATHQPPPADADLTMPGDDHAELIDSQSDDDDPTAGAAVELPAGPPGPAAPLPPALPIPPVIPPPVLLDVPVPPPLPPPAPAPPPVDQDELDPAPGRAPSPPPVRARSPSPARRLRPTERERLRLRRERGAEAARRAAQADQRAARAARRRSPSPAVDSD